MVSNRKVTFQHRVEYFLWNSVARILRLLPRNVQVWLADGAGTLMYKVFRVRRDSIDSNLLIAFPESSKEERERIGLAAWQGTILTFFEFVQPGARPMDQFGSQEGFVEYCEPLKKDPGHAIVVTGHSGNWEALASLGQREKASITAIAKTIHNPLINQSILESRKTLGVEILQVSKAMRSVPAAIERGDWVVFVSDQDARKRGIFVNFFNKPASTAEGAAHYSLKYNLPILPAFCVRLPEKGRPLKLVMLPPIYPDSAAPRDEEILRLTQEHTIALESVIRRYPESYFWLHNRWKTQPKELAAEK